MQLKHYLQIVLLLSTSALLAQEDKNEPLSDKIYLGQTPPGTTPEIFAPGIISTEGFEFSGTFSMDGKEYFFTRRPSYESNENRIFYTQLIDNKWGLVSSKNLGSEINATKTEFGASVSPDGKYLFFHRRTNGKGDIYWVDAKIIEDLKTDNR